MKAFKIAMSTAALAFALGGSAQAQDKKAEVLHWWTSGGESAAIKVFADAFAGAGGEQARAAGVTRIVGGEPPTAMQFNTGEQFDELASESVLRDLDDIAAEGAWRENLPPVITSAIERDGKIFAAPVNIHGENWFWYNNQVLTDAGVEPPADFADLIAAAPALKKAGVIPLALGGQAWQERSTFLTVLLGDNDTETAQGDAYRRAAETFAALRYLVDEGSPGRNWNDVSAMDSCAQQGMAILQDEAKQIPSVNFLATPDLTNDPDMSVDTFIENTVSAMESAG